MRTSTETQYKSIKERKNTVVVEFGSVVVFGRSLCVCVCVPIVERKGGKWKGGGGHIALLVVWQIGDKGKGFDRGQWFCAV